MIYLITWNKVFLVDANDRGSALDSIVRSGWQGTANGKVKILDQRMIIEPDVNSTINQSREGK
jgi:hypothetical protein